MLVLNSGLIQHSHTLLLGRNIPPTVTRGLSSPRYQEERHDHFDNVHATVTAVRNRFVPSAQIVGSGRCVEAIRSMRCVFRF